MSYLRRRFRRAQQAMGQSSERIGGHGLGRGDVLLTREARLLANDHDRIRRLNPDFHARSGDFQNFDLDVVADGKTLTGAALHYKHGASSLPTKLPVTMR